MHFFHQFSLFAAALLICCSTVEATNELNYPFPEFLSGKGKILMNFEKEGPYIFYKRHKTTIKYLRRTNSGFEVEQKVLLNDEELPTLICPVEDKEGHSFKVKIRKEHPIPATKYEQPKKLFAISDIEGEFAPFVASLIGNGVINKDYNWTYGEGHLVLVGDFFDRGNDVTACLWLIYKLEAEAKKAGGMVHFIIGNHEEMNMRGDVRYVRAKYKLVAKKFGMRYRMLFGPNTELGRWLRSKNVAERIGETIFVHGGLSEYMADMQMTLERMNKISRKNFGKDKFTIQQGSNAAEMIFGKKGPMWYRGYFNPNYKTHTIDKILHLYGAKQVVVGHTVVSDISTLVNGRVYAIDVKHDVQTHMGGATALLIEGKNFYKVNVNGKKSKVEPFTSNEVQTEIPKVTIN